MRAPSPGKCAYPNRSFLSTGPGGGGMASSSPHLPSQCSATGCRSGPPEERPGRKTEGGGTEGRGALGNPLDQSRHPGRGGAEVWRQDVFPGKPSFLFLGP